MSLPEAMSSTPVMIIVALSTASGALKAGRKPPSAIFITRAWASVVLTRGGLGLVVCARAWGACAAAGSATG